MKTINEIIKYIRSIKKIGNGIKVPLDFLIRDCSRHYKVCPDNLLKEYLNKYKK
jgi:hypothetical protein